MRCGREVKEGRLKAVRRVKVLHGVDTAVMMCESGVEHTQTVPAGVGPAAASAAALHVRSRRAAATRDATGPS